MNRIVVHHGRQIADRSTTTAWPVCDLEERKLPTLCARAQKGYRHTVLFPCGKSGNQTLDYSKRLQALIGGVAMRAVVREGEHG
ncbi:MAG: hypothetical protein KDJ69_16905 [Nitratireductor sp.]|nr:hypothetical protein [Nitratireductor sp.]